MSAAALVPPPAAPAAGPLTLAEFFARYCGQPYELVRGRAVEVPMAGARHGKVCFKAAVILGGFVIDSDLGHAMSNDTLIRTRSDPDGARGADVCFISYARLPKGAVPDGPLEVAPELVVEVRSPSDRWTDVVGKGLEYLDAGVTAVVILDPPTASAVVYRADARSEIVEGDQPLTLPDVLPGFAVPVSRFFA
jgi:Uma2 family endonuclease